MHPSGCSAGGMSRRARGKETREPGRAPSPGGLTVQESKEERDIYAVQLADCGLVNRKQKPARPGTSRLSLHRVLGLHRVGQRRQQLPLRDTDGAWRPVTCVGGSKQWVRRSGGLPSAVANIDWTRLHPHSLGRGHALVLAPPRASRGRRLPGQGRKSSLRNAAVCFRRAAGQRRA